MDCEEKCKYGCFLYFSQKQRKEIFNSFWQLNDAEKNSFYGNTTNCQIKERKRGISDRKKKAFKYYLVKDMERVRVSRSFTCPHYILAIKESIIIIDAQFLAKRGKTQRERHH